MAIEDKRQTEFLRSSAQQQRRGWASSLSPARLTRAQLLRGSKAKIAESISEITVRRRPSLPSPPSFARESCAEIVHLEHDFAERIAGGRAPPANRVVAFADRRQNI
jgi:hypothetical protein